MNHLAIIIPFAITFIYIITLPLEQYITTGEHTINYISDRIYLANTIQTMSVQQDKESDENEPITDLPVIDTPCKSPCPPSAEMCIYMCK
jgi:hypothetical protein